MYFQSIDAARNRFRWYALDLQPDLFGGTNLVRRWGRIGTRGAMRLEHFPDCTAAAVALDAAVQRRRQRGYHEF